MSAAVTPNSSAAAAVSVATGGNLATASQPSATAAAAAVRPFYNPTLPPIPAHLVKAIQNGKYVDFGDLLPEALSEAFDKAQQEGKEDSAKAKKKHPINSPVDWGLAFSTFAAVTTHFHPERAPQLITYSNIIFRLAREVKGKVLQRYDRAFRQAAASQPMFQWNRREPDVWLASIAEDGRAQGEGSDDSSSSNTDTQPPRRKRPV